MSHAAATASPVDASAAAGEEDQDHAEEDADGGRKQGPGSAAVLSANVVAGAGAAVVSVVDLVPHQGEGDEVAHERYQRHREGQQRRERRQQAADEAGAEGEEEGYECLVSLFSFYFSLFLSLSLSLFFFREERIEVIIEMGYRQQMSDLPEPSRQGVAP